MFFSKAKAVLVAICLLGLYASYVILFKSVTNTSKIILIQKGQGASTITKKLDANFTTPERLVVKIFNRIYFYGKNVNYGEYEIEAYYSYFNVAKKVASAQKYYHKLTLIDGETTHNFTQTINNTEGLVGIITEPVSEGYLMPDTYNYLYGETKNSIILRAKNAMSDFLHSQLLKYPLSESFYLKTPKQVLIMASIIQAEAANEAEKQIIASVFQNRIAKQMRLQTDPTVIYQITKGQYKLERRLTFADLSTKGEYNTYQIDGLPPTSINNPSRSSIFAALNPAKTDYLYFVLKPSLGRHVFSQNYSTHVQNAEEYRKSEG